MPIHEVDPWRAQYFDSIPCPANVDIPTEDADAWAWHPQHRWVYDKLAIAHSQGLPAAPHGVMPPSFPIFSKPMMNLHGMGIGSRVIRTPTAYRDAFTPGHFWMPLLTGDHVSTDAAILNGRPVWWRHATGTPRPGGTFDRWTIHAAPRPTLETTCGAWITQHLPTYTGMLNLETIGNTIIEAHLRFADQWPDLYGKGWVQSLITLYAHHHWTFDDTARQDGYSVVLFAPHHATWRRPPPKLVRALLTHPQISSIQITYHPHKPAHLHAMPPGGFRLAIINCTNLQAGRRAHRQLAEAMIQA